LQKFYIKFKCGAGTGNPSGEHEFTLVFSGVRVARSLVFCVVICRSVYGCTCPDNTYLSGDRCVAIDKCGSCNLIVGQFSTNLAVRDDKYAWHWSFVDEITITCQC
jgi:hypothetical protein